MLTEFFAKVNVQCEMELTGEHVGAKSELFGE